MRAASSYSSSFSNSRAAGTRLLVFGGDRLVEDRLALLAQEAGQAGALLLGDVRTVEPDASRRGRRQKQHVALAEQLLGAVGVENRARVDLRRHAERDARRQVGLDQSGDDVHRRALRRQDQMDADGARHLRQPADRFLDLVARDHHQVRELVDHDDDERQRLRGVGILVAGLLQHELDVAVVLLDVADAFGGERLVALFHLAHGPAQRVGRFLRIDDDGREQMGDLFVHPELESLRVDHDHPHVVGRGAVEDAREHRSSARPTCRCPSSRRSAGEASWRGR